MKISGCVFKNKYIHENTEENFCASYKGMTIYVSTNHGFGKAKEDFIDPLKRYFIEVTNNKNGIKDMDTWEDHHSIYDAIESALKGACLIQ